MSYDQTKSKKANSPDGFCSNEEVYEYLDTGHECLQEETASDADDQISASGTKLLSDPGKTDSEHSNLDYEDRAHDAGDMYEPSGPEEGGDIKQVHTGPHFENSPGWDRNAGGDAPNGATYNNQGGKYSYKKME